MDSPNPWGRRRAFSLVELLVVLGIICVLVSLLLPVVHSAKQDALRIQCATNLRTIGQAFQMYDQEWKRLPGTQGKGSIILALNTNGDQFVYKVALGSLYDQALLALAKKPVLPQQFSCPVHKLDRADAAQFGFLPSYGMNWYYDGQRMAGVSASTILAAEVSGPTGDGSHAADRDSASPGELAPYRHRLRSNYLFFDGHVDLLTYDEASGPGRSNWGTDRRGSGAAPAFPVAPPPG